MNQAPAETEAKYLRIARDLRAAIARGQWQEGGRLPRFRELASRFGTTHPTMSRALERLEREGLIERIHGKGMYVRARPQGANAGGDEPGEAPVVVRVVPVVMRAYGHLYGDIFQQLVMRLGEQQLRALPVDFTRWPRESRAHIERELESTLALDVAGMIVDAWSGLVAESFESLTRRVGTMVFINHYELLRPIAGANCVLADYAHAGYLGAQALLRRGGRRIVFFRWPRSEGMTDDAWRRSLGGLMHRGAAEAMREAGLDPQQHLHLYDDQDDPDGAALARRLADGCDGVLCTGDALAPRVYHAAAQAGRSVGADLPVIGTFNTPWTQQLVPSLSSISINERQLADRAAELLIGAARNVFETIPPVLVERESTGAVCERSGLVDPSSLA